MKVPKSTFWATQNLITANIFYNYCNHFFASTRSELPGKECGSFFYNSNNPIYRESWAALGAPSFSLNWRRVFVWSCMVVIIQSKWSSMTGWIIGVRQMRHLQPCKTRQKLSVNWGKMRTHPMLSWWHLRTLDIWGYQSFEKMIHHPSEALQILRAKKKLQKLVKILRVMRCQKLRK